MYKPYDFDPSRQYPIVAYVYPGPQTEAVSKSFQDNPSEQGLAQFGVIVVTLGNRGGHPDRSKWYHKWARPPVASLPTPRVPELTTLFGQLRLRQSPRLRPGG